MSEPERIYRRYVYPSEGQVVVKAVHHEDSVIEIIYDDGSYMFIKKVQP